MENVNLTTKTTKQLLFEAAAPRRVYFDFGAARVYVREPIVADDFTDLAGNRDIAYHLVTRLTFDENDQPVFSADDVPALKATARGHVLQLITTINGFFDTIDADKKEASNAG